MKLTREYHNKTRLFYTLVPISKAEIKRRGLFATKLSNSSLLIALPYEKKVFRKRDSDTWGHIYKGGYNFGVCEKVYKSKDAYLIIEQPIFIHVKVHRQYDFYNKPIGFSRVGGTGRNYKNIHSIALSNKALFGVKIGGCYT
jgi:hypothetical protein